MAIHRRDEAVTHRLHGAVFHSYVAPAAGSEELCAWRVEIAPGTDGVRHRVGREEVLVLTDGRIRVFLDGVVEEMTAGDVLRVPAGAEFGIDNAGPGTAAAWVTTSVGFAATLPDGSLLSPPWVR
ncbi:cupin domain-containing protein [Actinoplanes teichomyceticus]|uniref:Cupin domain n=1 Tax=Actinoplanes teichomyceticus TaxID=1867 RepID=A0A561VRZ9_ACTTI|nr:cupin domain-containing protein [Actinoplanes teichomyceticus]TWG14373.1 cupin domain [Actinoplanes teichomyceticus]GIF13067.1 cupin [Actinoplanes teichomyceticus]